MENASASAFASLVALTDAARLDGNSRVELSSAVPPGLKNAASDSPAIKDYLARHKASAANGAEPDRWASAVTYASLQMLQQLEKLHDTMESAPRFPARKEG